MHGGGTVTLQEIFQQFGGMDTGLGMPCMLLSCYGMVPEDLPLPISYQLPDKNVTTSAAIPSVTPGNLL